MSAKQIVAELKSFGSATTAAILKRHGAREPVFGAKIGDIKKIVKRVKKNHALALELFDTGIYDAMYLAGLIADERQMTKSDLEGWLKKTYCTAIGNHSVAWVAAESAHGEPLALKWIESKRPINAAAGWATLSYIVALRNDDDLDVAMLEKGLERIGATLQAQTDEVKYAMNNFLIAVGSYVRPLTGVVIKASADVGEITIDMGDTDCNIPNAGHAIEKVRQRGAIGKKRKTVRC